jgi:hypothetical protein
MVRCIVTCTLSLLVVSLAAEAQPAGKVYQIGILAADTASSASTTGFMEVFQQANLQGIPCLVSFEWIILIFSSLNVHVNEADH